MLNQEDDVFDLQLLIRLTFLLSFLHELLMSILNIYIYICRTRAQGQAHGNGFCSSVGRALQVQRSRRNDVSVKVHLHTAINRADFRFRFQMHVKMRSSQQSNVWAQYLQSSACSSLLNMHLNLKSARLIAVCKRTLMLLIRIIITISQFLY